MHDMMIRGPSALQTALVPQSMPHNEAQRISNKGYSPGCLELALCEVRR